MFNDKEQVLNLRRRATNLTPNSPYSAFLSLLDCLIDIVRAQSLSTGATETGEERDARRFRINERKQQLLDELKDPARLYEDWRIAQELKEQEAAIKRQLQK